MEIVTKLIFVIIAIGLIGAMTQPLYEKTNILTTTESFTMPDGIGVNSTLSGFEFESLNTVTNGTTTIDEGNYTIISTIDGENHIYANDDISSYYGGSLVIDYNYYNEGRLTGASALIFSLIILIVIAGFIMMLSKDKYK